MITLIASIDNNYGIGDNEGNLLFKIPKDMKHFKDTTVGKIVVFGRKTAESLPNKEPLSRRINLLLTRDIGYNLDGFICIRNKEVILDLSKSSEVFICGGGKIYEEFIEHADRIIITHVHSSSDNAEVFFPNINKKEWEVVKFISNDKEDSNPSFDFIEYRKIK